MFPFALSVETYPQVVVRYVNTNNRKYDFIRLRPKIEIRREEEQVFEFETIAEYEIVVVSLMGS
jgi:hypothetical protein